MMNKINCRPFDMIFCIRAREKVEHIKEGSKIKYKEMGIQPIQEKNFWFEMLVATIMEPINKFPTLSSEPCAQKVPGQLTGLFSTNRFIGIEDGKRIRQWIDKGKPVDFDVETLKRDCRDAALRGTNSLMEFWGVLDADKKAKLGAYKDEQKKIAAEVDAQKIEISEDGEVDTTF